MPRQIASVGSARRTAARASGATIRWLATGKVFVEGYWYTVARADAQRESFDKAWELRTPHVRLRTNLPHGWAVWMLSLAATQLRLKQRLSV